MTLKRPGRTLLCVAGIFLAGCGRVYHIVKVTPSSTAAISKVREKQDGVLYYVKAGSCRHETKYEEPIFDVVVTNTDSKAIELQRSLGLKAYQEFQAKLANKLADAKAVLNDEPAYVPTDFKKTPPGDDLLLIANRNVLETVVDYGHPYYYNVNRPISGSSTADIKIAPDGTMNEASATAQSDTLKTILSAIPSQTLLSAALTAREIGTPSGRPAYTVSVAQRSYVWTVSAPPISPPTDEAFKQCPGPGPALEISAATIGNYNVTREIEAADNAKAPAPSATPPAKPN